jgi:hypothetical protein
MNPPIFSVLAILFSAATLFAAAPTVPPDQDAEANIDRLIRQLAGDDAKLRDAAQKALDDHGEAALPALRTAAKGKDPQLAQRAGETVNRIVGNILSQWLKDKEVVAVTFCGPDQFREREIPLSELDELARAASSLSPSGSPDARPAKAKSTLPPDFQITPATSQNSLLMARLKVTPESTRYLLALQAFLEHKDFHLELAALKYEGSAVAYKCDEKVRQKAREILPQALADFAKALTAKYPNAECTSIDLTKVGKRNAPPAPTEEIAAKSGELLMLGYKIPGTEVVGEIHVAPLNVSWKPYIALAPRQQFRMPHLALLVYTYHWPLGKDPKDATREPIAKMIEDALAPLADLEKAAGRDAADGKPGKERD